MEQLFQQSFSVLRDQKREHILMQIARISDKDLLSPNAPNLINRIIEDNCKFGVAKIDSNNKRGRRRIVKEKKLNAFGKEYIDEIEFIDVYIPYSDYPSSFLIAPSTGGKAAAPATLEDKYLVASFLDDDQLEENLHVFISAVSNNLSLLQKDIDNLPNVLKVEIYESIENRLTKLRARQERDRKRSFPIE